ncbi:sensor histidine kinase [Salipaludibacillus sp. CF4.18]|uniref:sensor histidine kinase n=1 Tax=Salipaludibacillus sp. CF4.18 TaxID=3373081 RepID=UPI003EE657FF
MNLFIRQTLLAFLGFSIVALILLFVTFTAFPITEWSLLWQVKVFDLPYLYFILAIIGASSLIVGMSQSAFWRKKLGAIRQNLDDLIKGQKLGSASEETVQELTTVQEQIFRLESKLLKQTEAAQKLATERTDEREKSLQEVVIQERNRLARELHDSVSQQLFAASMMMATINETNPPEDPVMKKQLAMIEKMIDQSQLEMRALLLHLRPAALKGKSLTEGINELLIELKEKVPMEMETKIESLDLDRGVEDHLFRILQESISNTLRHSKASHLQVMLIERDDNVIMRIADDGVGFDVQEVQNHGSYGMQSMSERALEIGGTLKVVSVREEGTRLEVKVPAIRKEGETDD